MQTIVAYAPRFDQTLQEENMNTIRPYTHDEELRELSFQYAIDSHQQATQAALLLNDSKLTRHCQYHIGYLSKINVLLYMSIECSLKALICALRIGEAPCDVYWKQIRPAGHSLTRLRAAIPHFSAEIGDAKLEGELNRLEKAEVSDRYCLEVSSESDLMKDFNIDETELQAKIEEAQRLLETAKNLRQRVWDLREVKFRGHRTLCPQKVKGVLTKIKAK